MMLPAIFCPAQTPADMASRKAQLEFIRRDTLPVEINALPGSVNTQFSEYNGVLFPDSTFYFSSLRPESENDYAELFEQFWTTKIYRSKLTIGGYSRPTSLSAKINDDRYYNCNFTFNTDRTLLVFSRCLRESGRQLQCNLWKSDCKAGKWSNPQMLNRRINLPGTTTTQPCWVDMDNYSVMYFVSDRPRGQGELDIWYTICKNGHFDDPVNAGSILNSADNEVTPFYDPERGRMYFSSDAPDRSIGGYDIFYADGALAAWSEPGNIGVPINSDANDIYFTVNGHDKEGYFASNRPKNPEDAADTCCTDLYHYRWLNDEGAPPQEETPSVDTVSVAEKAVMLLPITLYFHNDEPDPRTTDTTTRQNYRATLADYLAMEDTYKAEYSRGLKGTDAEIARGRIERFFEDSVRNGFRKLEEFSQFLLADLQSGNSVTLTVCGFASPLHRSDYNLALSSRRIASFVNYLKEYRNGIFLPYLNGKEKARLTILREPEGSALAKKDVSDNPNDRRNSVYSIAASVERKIQITRYEVTEP